MKAVQLINVLLEGEDLLTAVRSAGFDPQSTSDSEFVSVGVDQLTPDAFSYVAVAVKTGDGYAIRVYSNTGNVTSKFFGEPPRGVTRYDMAYATTAKDVVAALIRVRDAAELEHAERLSGLSDELKSVNEDQTDFAYEVLAEEGESLANELSSMGYRAMTNFKPSDVAGGLTMCVVILLSDKDDFDFRDGSAVITRYTHESGIRVALLDAYHSIIGQAKIKSASAREVDRTVQSLRDSAASDRQDVANEIRGEL